MENILFNELSRNAQGRVLRRAGCEAWALRRPRGWRLYWPTDAAQRAWATAAGFRRVAQVPDRAPAAGYAAQYGEWGVVANPDGTYTLRRSDGRHTLRLNSADLTDVANLLVQVEIPRQLAARAGRV